jgi:hypothetical protein
VLLSTAFTVVWQLCLLSCSQFPAVFGMLLPTVFAVLLLTMFPVLLPTVFAVLLPAVCVCCVVANSVTVLLFPMSLFFFLFT